jgi:photosystem II stability/assembly factor-like uncharacterized protein
VYREKARGGTRPGVGWPACYIRNWESENLVASPATDGGATWSNVLRSDQHIYDVAIDPRDPSNLYACGFESSAWRSTDHGETWQRIRGFNFKWGHRVIPDPLDPARIYITTFGGSVWHGPAEGDPAAVEDIVTPALAFSR